MKSSLQVAGKPGAEEAAEHLDGQKKVLATGDPTRVIKSDSATGDDAMEMGMMMKVLSPGMEHRQKALRQESRHGGHARGGPRSFPPAASVQDDGPSRRWR